MTAHFHQPTQPISIFLENHATESENFVQDHYDLKITLAESTQFLAFEPLVSIVRFGLKDKTEEAINELFQLPTIFAPVRPVVERYIRGLAPGVREPINTDELAYEQIEIFKAMSEIIQACFQDTAFKVAISNAQFISPSAFELLQREDYRMPNRLQLDFYLSTDAFKNLKVSQGFSTQIKRRHLSAPFDAGKNSKSDASISLDSNVDDWLALANAASLNTPGEILLITEHLENQGNLTLEQQGDLHLGNVHAWELHKNPERCHIYIQELQHYLLNDIAEEKTIQTLRAITTCYLNLQEYSSSEKAAAQYLEFAQARALDQEILLAKFYIFLAQAFTGRMKSSADELVAMEHELLQNGWTNLAAFIRCSYWFNEVLIDEKPDLVISRCLEAITDYEKSHNIIGQSTAHHHTSIVLGSVGRPDEAIAHINKALSLTQQCGLSVRIHNTLNGLAFLLNGLGQTDAAKEAIEAAYPLVLADGNFEQICTTLFNLALVSFYADHMQSTIQILDDLFSVMEFRNMTTTRFRTKGEILALQAIAAYLDGDRRLPFAVQPQLQDEPPRSHEGEAFIRCIGLITQPFSADEAEHFFLEISEQFSKFRQNVHLDLLALRLLVTYLTDIGETQRAQVWTQQGLKQCKTYRLESRENWFKGAPTSSTMQTTVEPIQAINLAQHKLGIDALKLENGLLNTLAAFNDTAFRSSNIEELITSFLENLKRLVNVSSATISLTFFEGDPINSHTKNNDVVEDLSFTKTMTFKLKYIGGDGTLTVSFLGDLINRSHDAKNIIEKICQQLSRSIEFILDRLDSHHLAFHDPLTNVYNRVAFEEDIDRILNENEAKKLCLAFIDLDRFKSVNDTLGHLAGDQFLRAFVDVLATKVRINDRIYRIGGDEFLVCFQDIELSKIEKIFSRFITTFFSSNKLKNIGITDDMNLGCSIGLIEQSLHYSQGIDVDKLIAEADQLMYQAKRSSSQQICSKSI